jgi:DeoR/GlpR family transcriptional regulator of sugar metabolism
MKSHRDSIIKFIKKKKIVTSNEVAKFMRVSWNTADSDLKELLIEGKVERVKKEGTTLWIIK